MATTTYDINVRYDLQDRASKGAKNIGNNLQQTSKRASGLGSSLAKLAVLAGTGFGLGIAKKFLIDYNSQLQDTKLTMTGLMKLNLGGSWAANQKEANVLIEQFKLDAKASAGTMKDFADFAEMITGPVLRAGLSMGDLRDITKGGVVAAKAFGIEASMASLDIEQALAGTLSKKDRFARALLEPMGIDTETWNKMATDTPELIGQNLVKAFNQPALLEMAKAYEKSWSGVTSTLEDNIQQALGKVGLPLMEALSAEVIKLNQFFEKNPEKIEKFIKALSEGLIDGFKFVKDVISFLVKNAGTLMSLAKAFVGFKVAQGVGGMLAGPLNMIATFGDSMGGASTKVNSFGGVLTSAAAQMQATIGIMAAVAVAANFIAEEVDRGQTKELKAIGRRPQGFLSAATEGLSDEKVLAQARTAGILKDGEIDLARYANAMKGIEGSMSKVALQKELEFFGAPGRGFGEEGASRGFVQGVAGYGGDKRSLEAFDRLEGILEAQQTESAAKLNEFVDANKGYIQLHGGLLEYMRSGAMASDISSAFPTLMEMYAADQTANAFNFATAGTGEDPDAPKKTKSAKKNGSVKIYINSVKVESADPDRFAMHMIGAVTRSTTKPVASRLRLPGGNPA